MTFIQTVRKALDGLQGSVEAAFDNLARGDVEEVKGDLLFIDQILQRLDLALIAEEMKAEGHSKDSKDHAEEMKADDQTHTPRA